MVPELLRRRDQRAHELDGADEVAAVEPATDRVAGALPSGQRREALGDLLVRQALHARQPIVGRVRIASLVPSATEALFALGLGGDVVAVTHECDWPAEVRELPRLTRSVVAAGLGAAEIDAAVRELTAQGEAIYELDDELLAALEPELIVTQAVCPVCAVSFEDVRALAARLPGQPRVLSLDPARLGEVLADLPRLAEAGGDRSAGERLVRSLERRLAAVRARVAGAHRPRVLALEWLDPPYLAGHWVPEMVASADGTPLGPGPGERSPTADWHDLAALAPDVVLVMPCGLDADAAARQAGEAAGELGGLGARDLFALDAAASFSRPGPRLVDGVELLAHLLHPGLAPAPEGLGWRRLAP